MMKETTEILEIYNAKSGAFPSICHNNPIWQCLADNR